MGNYYIETHGPSQIWHGDESGQVENENTPVTNWAIGDPFILITLLFCDGACNKDLSASSLKLQFDKDSEGFNDVTDATEINYTEDTALVNDAVATDRSLSSPTVECSASLESGRECTDGALVTDTVTAEYWYQVQWALDTANATPGSTYAFQVYSNSATKACDNSIAVTITMAEASSSSSSESVSVSSSSSSLSIIPSIVTPFWTFGEASKATSEDETIDADNAWTYGENAIRHIFESESVSSSSVSVSVSSSSSESTSVSSSSSSSVSESTSESTSVSSSSSSAVPWYYPYELTITIGSINSGALSDTYADDGDLLVLNEVVDNPGFDYTFHFIPVPDSYQLFVRIEGYYEGNPSHRAEIQIYNFDTTSWEDLRVAEDDFPSTDTEATYLFNLPADLTDYRDGSDEVQLRIYHPGQGTPGHFFYIDEMKLESLSSSSESTSVSSSSSSESTSVSSSSSESVSVSSSSSSESASVSSSSSSESTSVSSSSSSESTSVSSSSSSESTSISSSSSSESISISSSSSSESVSVSSSSSSESTSISSSSSSQSGSPSSSSLSEALSVSVSSSSSSESESVSSSSESTSESSSSSESVSTSTSSSSSESVSVSSSSLSSGSISSSSVSVSFSSSSSSHDPIVHATTMHIEITAYAPEIVGFIDVSTMSLEFTTHSPTYPLYGRMGQPIITGSKPKVICEGSKAYVSFKARDAKILMSGY